MAGRDPKYPDLRYLFIRGLIQHEKCQRSRHYLKPAAECTSRAIVSLELSEEPVKTVKQARKLEGIGGETCIKLTKLEADRNYSSIKPLGGRFVSSAGGILVALLDITNEILQNGHNREKPVLIPEKKVKAAAQHLTEECFHSGQPEAFCPAWWRLEVLIKRGYIKRRSVKKAPVLQLLPCGNQLAQKLRERNGLPPASFTTKMPNLPSLDTSGDVKEVEVEELNAIENLVTPEGITTAERVLEESLYTNDMGADGLILLVDTQEMGGKRVGLGEVCQLLGRRGVVYRTRKLKTGDYSWVWRCIGQEIILPCLVERKRADDLAETLKEGRFWSQVNKMVEWKGQFAGGQVACKLYYLLERKPEEYVVKCTDGCQGIGQCGNPTLQQLKLVIEDLKRHPQLLVRETASLEMTTIVLASMTSELKDGIKEGLFDSLLQETLSENPARTQTQQGPSHPESCQTNQAQNMSRSSTSVSPKNKHAYGSDDLQENIKTENLTCDQELELALEISKKETSLRSTGCYMQNASQQCSGSDQKAASHAGVNHDKRKTDFNQGCESGGQFKLDLASKIDLENNEDDHDIAMAVQNSLQDMVGEQSPHSIRSSDTGEGKENGLSHPLMQYHCSAGGSIIYPHKTGYTTVTQQNGYRPKMNRKRTIGSNDYTNSSVVKTPSHSVKADSYNTCFNGRPVTEEPSFLCKSHDNVNLSSPSHSHRTTNSSASYMKSTNMIGGFGYSDLNSKDFLEEKNLIANYVKNAKTHEKTQVPKCNKMNALSSHCLDTGSLYEDSDSYRSPPAKSKSKKIRLHFTPSSLNTEINMVRVPASNKKNSEACKTMRKHAGDLNGYSKEIIPGRRFENDTLLSGKSSNDRSADRKLGACSFETSENFALNRCGTGDSKLESGMGNSDGYRSDEDLFPEAESTGNKATTDQPFLSLPSDDDDDDDDNVEVDKKIENQKKDFYTDLPKTSLDKSFSSSCSDCSLPDLDDIYKPKGSQDLMCNKNIDAVCAAGLECSNQEIEMSKTHKHSKYNTSERDKDTQHERILAGSTSHDSEETQSKTEEKVRTVMAVLPHVSITAVRSTLKTCGGDVELCVSVLLESQALAGEHTIDLTNSQND